LPASGSGNDENGVRQRQQLCWRAAERHLGDCFDHFLSPRAHCFSFEEASLPHELAQALAHGLENEIKKSKRKVQNLKFNVNMMNGLLK
jgi:hypothetical protein